LSPRNIERPTLSRPIDATIIKLRTLHKHFLTRFGGRGKKRTIVYYEMDSWLDLGVFGSLTSTSSKQ